jgi:hypothetical protein
MVWDRNALPPGVQLSTRTVSNVKHFESKKIYTERHELDNLSKVYGKGGTGFMRVAGWDPVFLFFATDWQLK